MKINWKVRAKNPQFWLQVALAVGVPVFAYYGISGVEITSWAVLGNLVVDAVSNPYVLFTTAVSLYNSITDPTTRGVSDSAQALSYDKPNEEIKSEVKR